MAEYLASIFGTEKDKVNCSFYFKIGACRHGDRCSRLHNKPTFSQTIVLLNLYRNPQNTAQTADGSHCHVSDVEVQEHYDNFFEEVFTELQEKYGEIEEMNVCDNLGDHLVGNVYVKFRREEDAERAVAELNNRWFNGQAVHAELSPVTDFRESCCRQYEMGECTRGGFCNFMHLRPISRNLRRQLYGRGPRRRYSRPGLPRVLMRPPPLSSGHPQGPTLAIVPERGTDGILRTTGTAASETGHLALHPDRCPRPGCLFKPHLSRLWDLIVCCPSLK
ncbi:splicing factor U2AF 26 kDa subunit isoform X1 [Lepus europaeus]|uniref:splicing factor U2AF 26 kDa subunit isoform X1 n=1 Tax=Lepus europaeus TaxID=9983 RepID=UPI002B49BA28|nr:splicing factor U2AF 26 kDa subunit isoform X1 [Lepus europaeus]